MLRLIYNLKCNGPLVLNNINHSILVTHLWNGLKSKQYSAELVQLMKNFNLTSIWKNANFTFLTNMVSIYAFIFLVRPTALP